MLTLNRVLMQWRKAHQAEAQERWRAERDAPSLTASSRELAVPATPWHGAIALIDFAVAGHDRKASQT